MPSEFLVWIPWLESLSCIFKVTNNRLSPSHAAISLHLFFSPSSFINKDSSMTESAGIISDNLPISVQFSSVVQSCLTLCNLMDCSMPGLPVHHQHPELTHVSSCPSSLGDANQSFHSLSSPSPAFNLSQCPGLFQWVSSSHQVAKVLELQYQSFQWILRTDFL